MRYFEIINETRSPLKLLEPDTSKRQHAKRMTQNPAFRAWFDQSMVRDQDGLPFMCYHGTGTAFTTFQRPTGENGVQIGKGIYVATQPAEAGHYAVRAGQTPLIMPLYVSAQHIVSDTWLWTALADGVFVHHLRAVIGSSYDPDEHGEDFDPDDKRHVLAQDRAIDQLRKEHGIDGVSDGRQIMVFDPWQVKAAYANQGKFSRRAEVSEDGF